MKITKTHIPFINYNLNNTKRDLLSTVTDIKYNIL